MAGERVIRVNVGGGDYTDHEGDLWRADKAWGPGSWGCANLPETDVLTTADPIALTDDPTLFRSMRTGERIVYRFELPNRTYRVGFLFAETYWESSDAERQDVIVGGKRVLSDFNIFDEAGHDAALEKAFEVKVTRGALEIRFEATSLPMHNGARVCAIAVSPAGNAARPKGKRRQTWRK